MLLLQWSAVEDKGHGAGQGGLGGRGQRYQLLSCNCAASTVIKKKMPCYLLLNSFILRIFREFSGPSLGLHFGRSDTFHVSLFPAYS